MPRKIILLLTVLISLLYLGCASKGNDTRKTQVKVPWQSYHQAMATGKGEAKPIVLHFGTDWNSASEKMKLKTYGNYDVAKYLQKYFATGWIDVEEYPALGKKYQVDGLPTIWILDSEGKTLTNVDGYLGPEKMLLILEFINTRAYENMSYIQWKDRRPRS